MRKMLLATMLASGCAGAWSEAVPGPNGQAYDVGCRRGEANCYREAARLCPAGYQVLDRWGGEARGLVVTGPNTAVITRRHGHMLVECRATTAQR